MSAASAYFVPFFIRPTFGLRIHAQIRIVDDISLSIAYEAIEKKMFGTIQKSHWKVAIRGEGHPIDLYKVVNGKNVRAFNRFDDLLGTMF